ncbi:unnamed protein product [Rotaria socialis]|uniref:Uncharacterized protein n=2 Tax=Rotaria socialis TaxID=392032 RepID=A0A821KNH5_9BILA|nr:unnamed protein product [Rotaria socialis]CAF4741366.1 unnamed protein product [Rotaria socialis]
MAGTHRIRPYHVILPDICRQCYCGWFSENPEIESMLHIDGMESTVIRELKFLLSENLNNRCPVAPLDICEFLLDPSQLKIDISRYLTQNQTTKELTLSEMIKKFRINHDIQVSSSQMNEHQQHQQHRSQIH